MFGRFIFLKVVLILIFVSCGSDQSVSEESADGNEMYIEGIAPSFNDLISEDTTIEILAEGFTWSEGPLWISELDALVFSDVPANTVYKWKEGDSISVYLKQSGFPVDDPRMSNSGANGLALDSERRLILCQHGNRQVAYMDADLMRPVQKFMPIAQTFEGKKFNSPNDLCIASNGTIFFTDPTYGLDDVWYAELPYAGVFKVDMDGSVHLLIDSLSKPNGVALSPDEKTLYVAVSDKEKAMLHAYQLDENQSIISGKILFDFTESISEKHPGLPDGLKIHRDGTIFTTGPGGVWILTPAGEHLGTIFTGRRAANLAFDDSYGWLYITAHEKLLRVPLANKDGI